MLTPLLFDERMTSVTVKNLFYTPQFNIRQLESINIKTSVSFTLNRPVHPEWAAAIRKRQRGDFHICHNASRLISVFNPRWKERSFLRYKREIFILRVLGFLKTTRSFPKIPEEVQSLPKTSEVCRRRSYRENAYPQNQRSRGRYCHLFILHMAFVPYMGLS